ncbi:hypothetical protein RHO13_05895 [Orbus wheelerorum]|uniref:hypothetical protein n=1 Tax=Orbus wheelerorum TaxID=3074111 RepID=UPI00370DCD4F
MKKIIVFLIFLFGPFPSLADSCDKIMQKPSLTFNDVKLLYNSENLKHNSYVNLYFKNVLNGISAYESVLILENKKRAACITNYDYLMKLSLLSNSIEMVDSMLKTTHGEHVAEYQPFPLLYMRALQYYYPCKD